MPFETLKAHVYALYRPALFLEDVFPRARRHRLARFLDVVLLVLLALALVSYAFSHGGTEKLLPALALFSALGYKFYGALLIVFCVRFFLFMLEAFHRSYYFSGLESVLEIADGGKTPRSAPVSFEMASIIHHTPSSDITGGFFASRIGEEIALRSGIAPEILVAFLEGPREKIHASLFTVAPEQGIILPAYARALFESDKALEQFLFEHGTSKEEFVEAAAWTMRRVRRIQLLSRWWSRENLGRIPGIGKTWSYGETYLLERYGHEMQKDPAYSAASDALPREGEPLHALETALAKSNQANALLVAADEGEPRALLACLAKLIARGAVLPSLEHKQIFILDPNAMLASHRDKGSFELELGKVMWQAVRAGNIIVVFPNLPGLMESAGALGTNLLEFLSPYLSADVIQVVATAETGAFHRTLLPRSEAMRLFEVVHVEGAASPEGNIRMLEDAASHLEAETGVIITCGALQKLFEGATRYFPGSIMPDKAIDLLGEVIPNAALAGKVLVGESEVDALLAMKTGVPLGEVSSGEREKLLSLETVLHTRVVGQEKAVTKVANALRRARAGVRDTNRPMGSFLFLGPTGVGKTETAKALAEAFFGTEDALMRLDMSEFQTAEALDRLIGSSGGAPGRLSTMLREKQFGVLLLDEFEKATRYVHDLFLQILDEGEFTDATGKKVNAHNILFIATSNAGAEKIWEISEKGGDILAARDELINEIISRGIFRPEFLNRFDDIILFHPLAREHIEKIARLKLAGLAKRLKARGVDLEITEEIVAVVADAGFDPKFGGRPMNRAIQEKVEQVVADKLLRGEIQVGSHVRLEKKDLWG